MSRGDMAFMVTVIIGFLLIGGLGITSCQREARAEMACKRAGYDALVRVDETGYCVQVYQGMSIAPLAEVRETR